MMPDEDFRWPTADAFSARRQLWKVYWSAAGSPGLWRDIGRYLVALVLYFLVVIGSGWAWATYAGMPWRPTPPIGENNWVLRAFDALFLFGGAASFNPFVPTYPICIADAWHYFLSPRSKKPVLLGRPLMVYPVAIGCVLWWYNRIELVQGWLEMSLAAAAMVGATALYMVLIGKSFRQLELPGVFTWHLVAWLATTAYALRGAGGVVAALLPIAAVILLLALVVALRGQGAVIDIASLETHDRDNDTLRLPAANIPLLLVSLIIALAVGMGICGALHGIGALRFSPVAFDPASRVLLLMPAVAVCGLPLYSTRSDAAYVSDQLADRFLVVRDSRTEGLPALAPGPATEAFIATRMKGSGMLTAALMVALAGGIVAAFGLATQLGLESWLFPLGDIGAVATTVVAVRGLSAFVDLMGAHYDSSTASATGDYVAPGASLITPKLGNLRDLLKGQRGGGSDG